VVAIIACRAFLCTEASAKSPSVSHEQGGPCHTGPGERGAVEAGCVDDHRPRSNRDLLVLTCPRRASSTESSHDAR